MATLNYLKRALREKVTAAASPQNQPLSDEQYGDGFSILTWSSGWTTYQDFIVPQLSRLLESLLESRTSISVLEIGPGPKSVLGDLPGHLRRKIKKYTTFEPNDLFAARLGEWLSSDSETERPLPCLEGPSYIHQTSFPPKSDMTDCSGSGTVNGDQKYDIILFCHSMYGMNSKHDVIEEALKMLVEQPEGGMVIVFHREGVLNLPGLVCHGTASFPTGVVRVEDDDKVLDSFASFIAGFVAREDIRIEWRNLCRTLGHHENDYLRQLIFRAPEIMVAFTKDAVTLPELTAQMPSMGVERSIKNREARLRSPASIVRPTEVQHIQQCVRWALKHKVGLTVIGGGHSGHCLWTNVVAVDMSAFDKVYVVEEDEVVGDASKELGSNFNSGPGSFIVAEAGCKMEDIARKATAADLTVPFGARPSVGAGLWLQGGIGHRARMLGLTCDAIVGAVVVSVDSGEVLCVGHVPRENHPSGAVRPKKEQELLWAIKGAGTNFGIVVSVTFKAHSAVSQYIQNWVVPLRDDSEARRRLDDFDGLIARHLTQNCAADAYLYWDAGQMQLGMTVYESSTTGLRSRAPTPTQIHVYDVFGPPNDFKTVDDAKVFETEMYLSEMHGGHGGGKTSSFKRCLFLSRIGEANVAARLVAAIKSRPSPLCYLHLVQGGGVVRDVAANATAFGCRDWDFACVITGVWPRDQDGTDAAYSTVQWVYEVAEDLLPISSGVYGADLGPDPRDAPLAARAFGLNRPRLAYLKSIHDPHNVLAYACPLPKAVSPQKLIILVTGEYGAGKDYCAKLWVYEFTDCKHQSLSARTVSISDAIKREYAAATGADLRRLLEDRAYKEQHRLAMTAYFKEQVRERPKLPEEHFLDVVYGNSDVDVLLITGMRDEAPVATFSPLVSNSRLLEVRVQASEQQRRVRRGFHDGDDSGGCDSSDSWTSSKAAVDNCPSFIFDNNVIGPLGPIFFGEKNLRPFVHEDTQRLADMVRQIPDFPHHGIEFHNVLGISQKPGGLGLCTSLLQAHFTGDWTKVGAVVSCEAGGFVFASALALSVNLPLVLIREAGKLPPPTDSIAKPSSYISSLGPDGSKESWIEMEQDIVPEGASVVVVDDVLSTGETLCAVLQLLGKAGIAADNVSVMVVAEFPAHRGRQLLRLYGYGKVNVQGLLIFGGA